MEMAFAFHKFQKEGALQWKLAAAFTLTYSIIMVIKVNVKDFRS